MSNLRLKLRFLDCTMADDESLLACVQGQRAWADQRLPNLDPAGSLRAAKRVRLLLVDEDDLTCPVCMSTLKNPVSCKNGHSWCDGCNGREARSWPLRKCPVCRDSSGTRATPLFLAKCLASLCTRCAACGLDHLQKDAAAHEWSCPMSTKKCCPFCSDGSVVLSQLAAHLREAHKDKTVDSELRLNWATPKADGDNNVWGKLGSALRVTFLLGDHWIAFVSANYSKTSQSLSICLAQSDANILDISVDMIVVPAAAGKPSFSSSFHKISGFHSPNVWSSMSLSDKNRRATQTISVPVMFPQHLSDADKMRIAVKLQPGSRALHSTARAEGVIAV